MSNFKNNERLVTRQTAEKLKALGFNWQCQYYYHGFMNSIVDSVKKHGKPYTNDDVDFSAPTQDVVQRWLREKMGVLFEVLWKFTNPDVYYYCKLFYKGTFYETELNPYYDEARECGIIKALELIEEQIEKYKNII